jgi:ABC-2 type transport system permease protein
MIRVEIAKLLRRPRTWASIVLLVLLPTIVAVFLDVTGLAPRPGTGPAFLTDVLRNGTLFPAAALAIVLPIFLPASVAVVAGDMVAGEAASGTLRYLLVRPVSRTRLLVAKLLASLVFIALAVLIVAGTGFLTGIFAFGVHPLASVSGGVPLTNEQVAFRIAMTILFIAWSMVGVAAIALFLSTITDSGLAAALGTLAVLVASTVLVTLDAAESVRPYLLTRYWLSFVDLFRTPILWRDIIRGFLLQAVYVGVLLSAAWANFASKDISS